MQNEPMLCVQDLSVRFKTKYGSAAAVNHVSFSLKKGEKLGLVGESGSGKSVTSKSIIRLLPTPPAADHREHPPQRGRAAHQDRAPDVQGPGQPDLHDLSGAHGLPEPGVHHWRPAWRRWSALHQKVVPRPRPTGDVYRDAAQPVGIPSPETRLNAISLSSSPAACASAS